VRESPPLVPPEGGKFRVGVGGEGHKRCNKVDFNAHTGGCPLIIQKCSHLLTPFSDTLL